MTSTTAAASNPSTRTLLVEADAAPAFFRICLGVGTGGLAPRHAQVGKFSCFHVFPRKQGQDGPATCLTGRQTHGQDARATFRGRQRPRRTRPAGSGRDGPSRTGARASKPARRGLHPLASASRDLTQPACQPCRACRACRRHAVENPAFKHPHIRPKAYRKSRREATRGCQVFRLNGCRGLRRPSGPRNHLSARLADGGPPHRYLPIILGCAD